MKVMCDSEASFFIMSGLQFLPPYLIFLEWCCYLMFFFFGQNSGDFKNNTDLILSI